MSSSTATALGRSSATCCTEGKVKNFSYDWVIKGFKFLPQQPEESIYSSIFRSHNGVEWKLCLYPRGYASSPNWVYIYLYLHTHKGVLPRGVHGKIFILPTGTTTTFYSTYRTRGQHTLAGHFRRSQLCDHDVVTIHLEMNIPLETITKPIGTTQLMGQAFDSQEGSQLIQDFRSLYKEPKFSDIDVIVGTQKFPAHKVVLASRSSVFAAMFDHKETQENLRNEVEIENMEPEVVKAMLEFCYTDEVTNLEDFAYGLLETANKYDLPRLIRMCEKILYKTLDKENAAELLIHADLHHSLRLKDSVMRFMDDHYLDVIKTDGYKEMAEKYPELVNELLLSIVTRSIAK